MLHKMHYRLALDLGSTSLGWAMIRLDTNNEPCAVIKAGVRIFSNGRNPKDGSSLAVTRREARAMRRRRDRLLKRKARMMRTLIEYGFFPTEESELGKKMLAPPCCGTLAPVFTTTQYLPCNPTNYSSVCATPVPSGATTSSPSYR